MKIKAVNNEKGFILVLALVTMLAMTIIGLSLVMNMTTDMQLSRNERDSKAAFQLAEAGINEAIARIRLPSGNSRYKGELSTDANYRTTAWAGKTFGQGQGGADESMESLDYQVTIAYLDETNPEGFCDSNAVGPNTSGNSSSPPASCVNFPAEVVMYGQDFNIDASISGITRGVLPVYRINSTGTSSSTTRTIEAYVGASSLYTDTDAAVNTNECIDISGGSYTISGGIKEAGSGGCATCDDGAPGCGAKAVDDMNTYLGEDLATVIGMADETHWCKGVKCSAPGDDIPTSGKINDVIIDWGDWAGDTYSRLVYIDNSGGEEVNISGGSYSGRGIFIVSGDLKLSGNFQYEGLVYVLGTLTISGGGGNLNVLGGVMANKTVQLNGSITVTYDQDTLMDVARQSGSSAILVWKRL